MTIHFYKAKIRDEPAEYFSSDDSELYSEGGPKGVLVNVKRPDLYPRDVGEIKEIPFEQYEKEFLAKGTSLMERTK